MEVVTPQEDSINRQGSNPSMPRTDISKTNPVAVLRENDTVRVLVQGDFDKTFRGNLYQQPTATPGALTDKTVAVIVASAGVHEAELLVNQFRDAGANVIVYQPHDLAVPPVINSWLAPACVDWKGVKFKQISEFSPNGVDFLYVPGGNAAILTLRESGTDAINSAINAQIPIGGMCSGATILAAVLQEDGQANGIATPEHDADFLNSWRVTAGRPKEQSELVSVVHKGPNLVPVITIEGPGETALFQQFFDKIVTTINPNASIDNGIASPSAEIPLPSSPTASCPVVREVLQDGNVVYIFNADFYDFHAGNSRENIQVAQNSLVGKKVAIFLENGGVDANLLFIEKLKQAGADITVVRGGWSPDSPPLINDGRLLAVVDWEGVTFVSTSDFKLNDWIGDSSAGKIILVPGGDVNADKIQFNGAKLIKDAATAGILIAGFGSGAKVVRNILGNGLQSISTFLDVRTDDNSISVFWKTLPKALKAVSADTYN